MQVLPLGGVGQPPIDLYIRHLVSDSVIDKPADDLRQNFPEGLPGVDTAPVLLPIQQANGAHAVQLEAALGDPVHILQVHLLIQYVVLISHPMFTSGTPVRLPSLLLASWTIRANTS